MKVKYENAMVLEVLNLPKIYDIYSFSEKMGLSTTIIYLLSKQTQRYYNSVKIPKKRGGTRQLDIPSFAMKAVQNWIKVSILDKIPISSAAMAYRKGKKYGIKNNAELHKGNEYILKIDFKDFFGSISREKVFYIFKTVGYNNTISDILTNLCTYQGRVPQGAITSPVISNIVCKRLDTRLKGLASKRNITYSRYADDLIFSSNDEVLLKKTKKAIFEIVNNEGFNINRKKIRFILPDSRKSITGLLIVEKKVIVPKKVKRKVRAMIHNMIIAADYSNMNKIKGYISYISSIEPGYEKKIVKYINNLVEKEQYKVFKDIVSQYNKNKIVNECNNMNLIDIDDCIEEDDQGCFEYNNAENYYIDRMKFLKKRYPEKEEKLNIEYKDIEFGNEEFIFKGNDKKTKDIMF